MKTKIRSINGSWHLILGANEIDLHVSASRRDGYTTKQLRREYSERIADAEKTLKREGAVSPY